jgi:antitoxin CptB
MTARAGLRVQARRHTGQAMEDLPTRLARLRFRAWHRGTRESDYIFGCFFDVRHTDWDEADLDWFDDLLNEEDVDALAWAMGQQAVPDRYAGPMMEALQKLDYVEIPR